MTSFGSVLEDTFRGRKVRAVGKKGVEYTGFVAKIQPKYRHLLLRSAVREDGESLGAVAISNCEHIELLDSEAEVKEIPVDQLSFSPYASVDYQLSQNQSYIADVRERGGRRTFPTIRRVNGGYEMVDGNKTLWVCRQAGVDSQVCEVVELTDWEATVRFVDEHIPAASAINEDGDAIGDWYSNYEIEEAIKQMHAEWGDRIMDLHRIEFNVERLGIELTE